MCDPILVTLLKMRPHYSQSSHEKGTPSSDTSLLASYKEYERAAPYERGGDARHLAKEAFQGVLATSDIAPKLQKM